MPSIKVKKGGVYADTVGIFAKKAGVYSAVAGVSAKVDGAYVRVDATATQQLFSAGEIGGEVSAANFATEMWQDVARTQPVTGAGQSVASARLKWGQTVTYAEQATAGLRPILVQDETGRYALDTTGGKWMYAPLNLSGTNKVTVWVGARKTSDAVIGAVLQFGVAAATGSFAVLAPGDAATANLRFELTGSAQTAWRATTFTAPTTFVASCAFDLSAVNRDTQVIPLVDGVTPTMVAAASGSAGGGSFGNFGVYIGGQGARLFSGLIYDIIVRGAATAADRIAAVTQEVNDRTRGLLVYRDLASNTVYAFVQATSDPASKFYTRVKLKHYVASDGDVWTVGQEWEAVRTGYESFEIGRELVPAGVESMCAIQEAGAADFMGGEAHGDEVMTATPTLKVDSQTMSLASGSSQWLHGAYANFSQTSRLFRVGSNLTIPLFARSLGVEFSGRQYVASNSLQPLDNVVVQNAYVCMRKPHRYEVFVGGVSEDTSSPLITGTFTDNVRLTPLPCNAVAAVVPGDYAQTTPRATSFKFTGNVGIEFETELVSTSDPLLKDVVFIQKSQTARNAGYIGLIGGYSGNQALTAVSPAWNTVTRFRTSKVAP